MNTQPNSLLIEGLNSEELRTEFADLKSRFDALAQRVAPPPEQPADFLTREEVAQLFKVTLPTIWAWTKKGLLKPYRIGNQVRYIRSEVMNAAQAMEQKGGPRR